MFAVKLPQVTFPQKENADKRSSHYHIIHPKSLYKNYKIMVSKGKKSIFSVMLTILTKEWLLLSQVF